MEAKLTIYIRMPATYNNDIKRARKTLKHAEIYALGLKAALEEPKTIAQQMIENNA